MSGPIDHTRVVGLYYRVVKRIEARTYSRRKLEGAQPAAKAGAKIIANAAEFYREIKLGLDGDRHAALKTRVIVRKLLNTEVLIEHDDDGSVWALATR